MAEVASKVLAVVVADFDKTAIGTRSRLSDRWGETTVIEHVVRRLAEVRGVGEIAVLTPGSQTAKAQGLRSLGLRVPLHVRELVPRPASIDVRVRIGRAWNLLAWRGGAGQWTVFDEEYHPAAIAVAAAAAFEGQGAEHVLIVHSHGVFLDVEMTSALVHHHLHKNREMRMTYTAAAPGLGGKLLHAQIVKEMGDANVMPWQLLGYDPKAPAFDTLIRDACMQVDPALSKVPNRFCVDTDRSWAMGRELAARRPAFTSLAEMCLAAASGVAPGVTDLTRVGEWPREVELELTPNRLTKSVGFAQGASSPMSVGQWTRWLGRQKCCDDLVVALGGLGDPLLFEGGIFEILKAVRNAGALSIGVQTDLAGGDVDGLLAAIAAGLVDVVSITMYGHTAATYAQVGGADLHGAVMRNLERLAEAVRATGGTPLVIPRLLKVRQTIPEMEAFFDVWVERCGWAVIDGPTDRAGSVAFGGVVDMAPPKRKACRRLWERLLIRADGQGGACDEDVANSLRAGSIENATIPQLWDALQHLRHRHAAGQWNELDPCKTCREWHRP